MNQETKTFRRRVRDAIAGDPVVHEARRHLHHDMTDVSRRRTEFLAGAEPVRALVLAELTREIELRQPGLRAGGFALIVGAVTTAAVIVGSFSAGILSSFLEAASGLVDYGPRDAVALSSMVSGTILTAAVAIAVLLILGVYFYVWQRATDQRRAVLLAWRELYLGAIRLETRELPKASWLARLLRSRPPLQTVDGAAQPPMP